MFDHDMSGDLRTDDAFELLAEIERNTPEQVRRQRAHFRLQFKTSVILQPGDASRLLEFKVQGVTGDLSEGGCKALFPVPIRVGDIYRLQFDRSELELPLIFSQCVRCHFIREGAYEAGFQFFTPITLEGRRCAPGLETVRH